VLALIALAGVSAVVQTGYSQRALEAQSPRRNWAPVSDENRDRIMLTAVARDPEDAHRLWLGYSDGSVYSTRDAQADAPRWQRLDRAPDGRRLLPRRAVTSLAVEPHEGRVFVGFSGEGSAANLWRASLHHQDFEPVRALPETGTVLGISAAPESPGLLYVHTALAGPLCSRDGGQTFTARRCAWPKLGRVGGAARVTTLTWAPSSTEVVVGFEDGQLYQTPNLRAANPMWNRLDQADEERRVIPSGAIVSVTPRTEQGELCVLVRSSGKQIWCGVEGRFRERQGTLPDYAFDALAQNPKTGLLTAVTRDVGVVGMSRGGAWSRDDRSLRVEYRDGGHGALFDHHLAPELRIVNEADEPVAYDELTLRYWYSEDAEVSPSSPPLLTLQEEESGQGSRAAPDIAVALSAATPAPLRPGEAAAEANTPERLGTSWREITISFGQRSRTLAPHAKSPVLRPRVTGASAFDESNDYSFDRTKADFGGHRHVGLYRRGVLVWGSEPASVASP
jgi:hypothetical protein